MAGFTLFHELCKPGQKPLEPAPRKIRVIPGKSKNPAPKAPTPPPKAKSPPPKRAALKKQPAPSAPARGPVAKKEGIKNGPTKRKRDEPAQRLIWESDRTNSEEYSPVPLPPRKKARLSAEAVVRRLLRADWDLTDKGDRDELMHAAELIRRKKAGQYAPAFKGPGVGKDEDPGGKARKGVIMYYPRASKAERYQLVRPRDKDNFDPVQDILNVTEIVPRYYLSPAEAEPFLNDSNGIHRRLKRAVTRGSSRDFRNALDEYNAAILALYRDGTFGKNIDDLDGLALPLVEQILTQIYARTVSLEVDSLRKYENGTDNVYGELLPRFVSDIFDQTSLTSEHIFVDLGSGVGNVVLQAALEIGCESWGCEVMDNACELAALQHREFHARCQLWGLATGQVRLERGDFLVQPDIGQILKKADVILVNNQAFTPELNDRLVNMFLDVKEGCRIISLKSFVPLDHKITKRNLNSPINLLEVEPKQYFSGCVSWTNAPGDYFIATKDARKLKAVIEEME